LVDQGFGLARLQQGLGQRRHRVVVRCLQLARAAQVDDRRPRVASSQRLDAE
jgi:hypothetical protein